MKQLSKKVLIVVEDMPGAIQTCLRKSISWLGSSGVYCGTCLTSVLKLSVVEENADVHMKRHG
jgi:hypothetical protein